MSNNGSESGMPCLVSDLRGDAFCFSPLRIMFTVGLSYMAFTMLNSNGDSGHPCIVPDFRGNAFSFSPLRIMFAVGLSDIAFIMLRLFLLFLSFYHKWMLNFVKGFLCIY